MRETCTSRGLVNVAGREVREKRGVHDLANALEAEEKARDA